MSSINFSGGLSSTALYQQITKQGEGTAVSKYVKSDPTIAAAEKAFTKAVSNFKSPNDLFSNYNALNFVLTALGETSQLGNVGLLKKVVASDPKNSKSVVNQLNDSGLTQLNSVLNTDGSVNASLQDPAIQAKLKNAYELAQYQNNLAQTNAAVPTALNFATIVSSAKSIYDILGNSTLRNVVSTVGHIPQQVVNQTLEAQAAAFAKVFDVSKANNPTYVQSFVKRYLGTSDANAAASSNSSSPILSLFSSSSGSSTSLLG
jgi:hypothetical protein